MEDIKNAKNNTKKRKKTSVFKRLVFLLLFIVLLPCVIIGAIVNHFVKNKKKNKWEKEGLRGKSLILKTTINEIDKMEIFEFENYLKTLFFYENYKVIESENDKGFNSFIIEKDNNKIVVGLEKRKKNVRKKQIYNLIKLMKIYKVNNSFFVTNSSFSSEAKFIADNNNIFLMNREKLIAEYEKVKELLTKSLPFRQFFKVKINNKRRFDW